MKPNASAAGAKTASNLPVNNLKVLKPFKALPEPGEDKQEVTVPQMEVQPEVVTKKAPTIEDLKTKIEKSHLLSIKHADLTGRLKDLEIFEIKKDGDTARMKVWDAKGETFESSNPVSIGKLVEIWKETYVKAINEVENEMFDLMVS